MWSRYDLKVTTFYWCFNNKDFTSVLGNYVKQGLLMLTVRSKNGLGLKLSTFAPELSYYPQLIEEIFETHISPRWFTFHRKRHNSWVLLHYVCDQTNFKISKYVWFSAIFSFSFYQSQVLRQLRKINWKDAELKAFVTKCLINAWELKYGNIHCLANLLAGLAPYHVSTAIYTHLGFFYVWFFPRVFMTERLVGSGTEIGLLSQRFPGYLIRTLFACTRVWSVWEKYLGNTLPRPRIEPGLWRGQRARYIHSPTELSWPGHGEDRQWDLFILPLSYHDPGHGEDRQWDTSILLLSYHDQGHGEDRQWDAFILSLSYHGPGRREDRQWDTFILPLSYHDWSVWFL